VAAVERQALWPPDRYGRLVSVSEAGAVYVASPLGFSEPGRHYLTDVLHPRLEAEGYEVLDPWFDPYGRFAVLVETPRSEERDTALRRLNDETGAKNALLIRQCSVVLALLDGAEPDPGTAAEVGYASALGRRVVGLRSDFRLAGDNDQSRINLQVEYFIRASGGSLETTLDAALAALAGE